MEEAPVRASWGGGGGTQITKNWVCQLVVGLELVVDLRVLLLEAPGVELRNVVVASRPHRRRLLIRRLFILVECRGIELRNVLDRFSATCSLQLGALLLALKALQKKEKN